MKYLHITLFLLISHSLFGQNKMNEEILWSLKRLSAETASQDGKWVYYGVSAVDVPNDKTERNLYRVNINGTENKQLTTATGNENNVVLLSSGKMLYGLKGQIWMSNADGSEAKQITSGEGVYLNFKVSADEKKITYSREVKVFKTTADLYPDLQKTKGRVFDALFYRHWDSYADEMVSHVFAAEFNQGIISNERDIMQGEPYDCPQAPMGGAEDFIFSSDGSKIYYVCKKISGTADALSTNTDIYEYDLSTQTTRNVSAGMKGYDTHPMVSSDGKWLVWLSMARDGYESDKQDLMLMNISNGQKLNLTRDWDNTVQSFIISNDNKKIFFTAYTGGCKQLFELSVPTEKEFNTKKINLRQVVKGEYDVAAIVGQAGNFIVFTRTDMNHAPDIYKADISSGAVTALTQVNKDIYDKLNMCKVEKRMIKTSDNMQMLTWVIYPPDFDANKKYPALLYCQGGPQSAVSQFYSYRWNFQLMASKGYIVIAPNRRGLPGFGSAWNEEISGDWGGQAMLDYMAAVDSIKKLPFVEAGRIGAVGASYGGYSVYMLAGIHNNRFKTFIAHCGLFDLRSWYGSTEEMWFANWDIGGPYWDNRYKELYKMHDPVEYAGNWNTPILVIHGGLDYRVPETQGMEAFQLAQLKGIKSRFVYFPDEGHWILKPQNGILWQREFYRWLEETL